MSDLKLPNTLLHDQADACLLQWIEQLPAGQVASVAVDASELVEFDSSVLAVLLGLRRALLAQGRSLQIKGMSPRLTELATLYGVHELLQPV